MKVVCPKCGSEEVEVIHQFKPYMMDMAGAIYRCKKCYYVFTRMAVIKFRKGQIG